MLDWWDYPTGTDCTESACAGDCAATTAGAGTSTAVESLTGVAGSVVVPPVPVAGGVGAGACSVDATAAAAMVGSTVGSTGSGGGTVDGAEDTGTDGSWLGSSTTGAGGGFAGAAGAAVTTGASGAGATDRGASEPLPLPAELPDGADAIGVAADGPEGPAATAGSDVIACTVACAGACAAAASSGAVTSTGGAGDPDCGASGIFASDPPSASRVASARSGAATTHRSFTFCC